jgi:hypothetical protein
VADRNRSNEKPIDAVAEGFVPATVTTEANPSTAPTVAEINEVRQQIEHLRAEIHTARSAPLPSSEAKRLAREQIEALAATGEPKCLHLIEHGHQVRFPELHVQGQVLGGNGGPAFSSHAMPNTLGILA